MMEDIPEESELEASVKETLSDYEDRYGVSVGIEDNGFEVHISYDDRAVLPSIGKTLDTINDSLDPEDGYILRADFRPDDSIYEISVEKHVE